MCGTGWRLLALLMCVLVWLPASASEAVEDAAAADEEEAIHESLAADEEAAMQDTTAADEEESLEFPPEIEKLLSETADAEGYGDPEVCIQNRNIRDTRILDDRHIVFEMPGKTYYLVQFKHRCPQLRRSSILIYETRASRLCRLDYIKAGNSLYRGDVGPPCSIPGFIPITVEQVALLDETLKAARKR
ncbi:MAG: DUF6491 family protein [Gammaproteobacteria bacterium]